MTRSVDPIEKMNGNAYFHRLGRRGYLDHILKTILVKCLSRLSQKYLVEGCYQTCAFSFDLIGNTISAFGSYEREQLAATVRWMREQGLLRGIALDVGANIGNHSLAFSRSFSEVVSFELNPRVFKVLAINAGLRPNIKPLNIGVSDTVGRAEFEDFAVNMGAARIIGEATSASTKICEVTTIDNMFAGRSEEIGMIKLDIEGYEARAIAGASKTLKRWKPLVLFEQNASDFVGTETEAIRLLRAAGYTEFFTVMPWPYFPNLPEMVRPVVTAVARLLFGYSQVIRKQDNIASNFYSFIIARHPEARNGCGRQAAIERAHLAARNPG